MRDGLQCQVQDLDAGPSTLSCRPACSLLVFHEQGRRTFRVNFGSDVARFVVGAARFDYLPAGCFTEVWSEGPPSRIAVVQIPAAFERAVLDEGRWGSELLPRLQVQDRRLERIAGALRNATAQRLPPSESMLLSVALVDRVHETALQRSGGAGPPMFSPVMRRMIAGYIDQQIGFPVDPERLSLLTGLARTQLDMAFRNSFGTSPHQFLLARRMEAAVARLASGVPVGELAHELGFSSHAHFSTVFLKYMGKRPSEFRDAARPPPGTAKS